MNRKFVKGDLEYLQRQYNRAIEIADEDIKYDPNHEHELVLKALDIILKRIQALYIQDGGVSLP